MNGKIELKEYYIIEHYINNEYIRALDKDFTDLYKVKKYLKDILDSEVNYNYVCNKNNSYALVKVVYNDSTKDWDYYEVLPKISIKDYSYMNYEDKEKYFKVND